MARGQLPGLLIDRAQQLRLRALIDVLRDVLDAGNNRVFHRESGLSRHHLREHSVMAMTSAPYSPGVPCGRRFLGVDRA